MNREKVELISLFFEGAIPLLGYFFFDWSFVEILLFYALDILASEYNFDLKSWYVIRKPKYFKGFDPEFRKRFIILVNLSFLSFVAVNALLILGLDTYNQNHDIEASVIHQIMDFLKNNFFLLPLLILARHMQTNMTFIKPHLYVEASIKDLIKTQIFHRSTLILGLALLILVENMFRNTLLLIVLMALSKMAVDYVTLQLKKSKKLM